MERHKQKHTHTQCISDFFRRMFDSHFRFSMWAHTHTHSFFLSIHLSTLTHISPTTTHPMSVCKRTLSFRLPTNFPQELTFIHCKQNAKFVFAARAKSPFKWKYELLKLAGVYIANKKSNGCTRMLLFFSQCDSRPSCIIYWCRAQIILMD